MKVASFKTLINFKMLTFFLILPGAQAKNSVFEKTHYNTWTASITNQPHSTIIAANPKKKSERTRRGSRRPKGRPTTTRIPTITEDKRIARPTPKMSIETNPLGLIFGVYNFELNFKLKERTTAGLVASYANYGFVSGFGLGANYYHYFDRFSQDWFATAAGIFGQSGGSFFGYTYKVTTIQLYGMGGYKWLWPTFMTSLGAGLQLMQVSYSATYSGEDELFTDAPQRPPVPVSGLAVLFNIGIPIY